MVATRPSKGKLRALLAAVSLALVPVAAESQDPYVVGTGDAGGVYYPVAGAVCSLVNRMSDRGTVCRAVTSAGSVANIGALRAGEARFAIVQNDIQAEAWQGSGRFADQPPFETLRTVFSLHTEALTVLARRDSEISGFEDLKGRRVNLGNVGSGQRATMEVLMDAMGWTLADFSVVSELSASNQTPELCEGDLEAGVYIVGHPAGVIEEAMRACDLVLVETKAEPILSLAADREAYSITTIPAGLYEGQEEAVATFGVVASLVTTADVPNQVVDDMVSAVMRDLDRLRGAHPSLAGLTPRGMAGVGLSLPLHKASERYFRVTGFLD